jgi:hypothetical protein
MTGSNKGGPPFERHWIYYRILKVAVLLLAAYFALKLLGTS